MDHWPKISEGQRGAGLGLRESVVLVWEHSFWSWGWESENVSQLYDCTLRFSFKCIALLFNVSSSSLLQGEAGRCAPKAVLG